MYWAQGSVIVEYQPKEKLYAGMAELADAQDLGSCEAIRVGSTPTTRTMLE